MEDLDLPRNRPGAAADILATLHAVGLIPDGTVLDQSARTAHYARAFEQLLGQGVLYRCICSRSETARPYAGTCRDAGHGAQAPGAWRLRLPDQPCWTFEDRYQGRQVFAAQEVGDPVLLRRDGIVAYQFAVVVDDLDQGITEVVRGADLLDSTPWQLAIIRALGATPPAYAHVPLLVEPDGSKLSKSRRSLPVQGLAPAGELLRALTLLRQHPPAALAAAPAATVLDWALANWSPDAIAGLREVPMAAGAADLGLPARMV